jgi:hypothetical protein
MGSGMSNVVNAIAVSGTDVFAGGTFSTAGGVAANLIARWNGTAWAALGSGMSLATTGTAAVNAIAVVGAGANRVVYAGGDFDSAGGVPAASVASWDGAAWHALGAGGGVWTCFTCGPSIHGNGSVSALTVIGTTLYAGGNWQQAGGTGTLVDTSGIASWNGTAWSGLGVGGATKGGFAATVFALATDGQRLFAGGDFDAMSGLPANRIARWYQSSWSDVGGGVSAPVTTIPRVMALAFGGGGLYVGGTFDSAGATPAVDLARWDLLANTWSVLGTGVVREGIDPSIQAIAADPLGGALLTGRIVRAGGREVNQVARWTGTDWSTLGEGFPSCSYINAIAAGSSGDVYAGGSFNNTPSIPQAGNTPANHVARWDGAHWSALPGIPGTDGVVGDVNAIAVRGSDVFVGGAFTSAGGVSASNIARWDGHAWSQLPGGGTNGVVNALAILGDYLYVGGNFSTAGTTRAGTGTEENIARWNLTTGSWSRLGAGLDFQASYGVKAISFWQGRYVLIGGDFDTVFDGNATAHTYALLQWDSTTTTGGAVDGWKSPGGGVFISAGTHGNVAALAVLGNDLFVGGWFTSAGSVSTNTVTAMGVVTQDLLTNKWSNAMGTGVGGTVGPQVNSLAVAGSDVFVGGNFATVSGTSANAIARWSTTTPRQWSALGSGLGASTCNSSVPVALALTASRGALFVGGKFISAGTVPSSHFAIWALPVLAVSPSLSTVAATPPSVLANGIATSAVTVTLRDTGGGVVPGKTVSLARIAGPGAPTISPASAVTDASGAVTFSVRSTTVGTDTFQATDVSDNPAVVINQTADVTFTRVIAVLPAMSNGAYGGYTTVAYLQNIGPAPAHVNIQYYDKSGTTVGAGDYNPNLPTNATWTVRQDVAGHSFPAGTAGSAVVSSDQPLAAFVNEFAPGSGKDATSYTAIPMPSGAGTTIFAPAIANGAYGGYTTGIGLINVGTTSTNLTVTYRDESGTAVRTQNLMNVPPNAYRDMYSGELALGLPAGFSGNATITSSAGPVAAVVNEVGPGDQFSSYAAVAAGATKLYAPVALNNAFGGYNTGIAMQNTTGTAGTVTVNFYDDAGVATTKVMAIAANGYLAIYQGGGVAAPPPGAYTATLDSTVPIAAIVNEVAPSSTSAKQSTSYNASASGSATLHLPLVESTGIDGWDTSEGIMNAGTAATTVTVTYYDTGTGSLVGTPQSRLLQPNAYWPLYQPTGGLPSGARASAVVTTSGGEVAVLCNEKNATVFMSYSAQ